MQYNSANTPLQIQRFWTEFVPDKEDPAKLNPVDMVRYGPLGRTDNSSRDVEVKRVINVQPFIPDNPASIMAHIKADYIRKAWEAFTSGQELPLNGTPLAAWNGLTPEQAEVFKSRGIRTVEEISILNDATKAGLPFPYLNEIVASAKRFVESADQTRWAASMADKDRQLADHALNLNEQKEINAQQRTQIEELRLAMAALSMRMDTAEAPEVKRGPGRPPKET